MKKKKPYYGKSISTNFPDFPHIMGFVAFSCTVQIYGETHAFPICRGVPQDGNWMAKKHSYYGKSISIKFSDFPHAMGFVLFSRTVELSRTMNYTIGWGCNSKKEPIL